MNNNSRVHHPMRLLGVFAYPDDESFCAGGTFARHVSNGAEVMVVSATRGEARQIRSAGVQLLEMVDKSINLCKYTSRLPSTVWRSTEILAFFDFLPKLTN